jgi:small subunit ribosomal protein S4
MGDPRKPRKKYDTPMHPWQKSRIDEEKEITKAYGTKTKKEIWKMRAVLRRLANQVKLAAGLKGEEFEKQKSTVVLKAKKMGLITEGQGLDDVLGLKLQNIMDRRLQTLVFRKGLALTVNQARQFIVHEHIQVMGRKITSPSYIITVEQENHIGFAPNSPYAQSLHPEIVKQEEKKKKQPTAEEKKAKKKTEEVAEPEIESANEVVIEELA